MRSEEKKVNPLIFTILIIIFMFLYLATLTQCASRHNEKVQKAYKEQCLKYGEDTFYFESVPYSCDSFKRK